MRIMLRLAKMDTLRWISHLDTMRTLQKAIRRADLPIALSQGFNPHQKMSFAVPLSVGVASQGEYVELELQHDMLLQEISSRLNHVLPTNMRVLSVAHLPESASALMALVQASRYQLLLPQGDEFLWAEAIAKLLGKTMLVVERRTKSDKLQDVDIRPGIYALSLSTVAQGDEQRAVLHADIATNAKLFVRLTEVLNLLAVQAGCAPWDVMESEPERVDMGVYREGSFLSLAELFPGKEG